MDAREFNKMVIALPVVRKQIGVMGDGTPLFVTVHALTGPNAPDEQLAVTHAG